MATAALLFSFSAILFLLLLLHAPAPGLANLLAAALDRLLDVRGLLELATRRNMILLCHAILFLILRDAGLLGAPARRRRGCSTPGEAATDTAAVVVAQTAAPVPARPHATRSAFVAPVHEHDAAGRVIECWPAADAAAATWAAPRPTTGPPAHSVEEAAAAVATKQIVLVESPRNDDDDVLPGHHDRAGVADVEPLEHPTAIADDDEKRTDDTAREQPTAGMEMEMEMELADDRTFEEFIESQRRKMRQESLQLLSYQYQAIATC